jgi:hypothetical protein
VHSCPERQGQVDVTSTQCALIIADAADTQGGKEKPHGRERGREAAFHPDRSPPPFDFLILS